MVKEDLSMKRCEDCDHYNYGMCEHEDHIIDTPEDREICEDFIDFEKWWNSLDDIEREEYNRFMEEL